MGLQQFLQDVRSELQEILWEDVPRQPVGREWLRLEQAFDHAATELQRLRASVEELSNQLAEKERRMRWLQTRVQVYLYVADRVNAWQHALELDQLRQSLDQERSQLRRRQQAYQAHRARVRHLERQLDDFPAARYANR
jgi:hypothetical protein